ncbi:hypothetical protein A3F00_02065 [Candidatus Daviesbacteria bacterium RIFCSPHIGHO2_12_FULL_37_11]|uniref:Glycosyl transferase family 1 domain-containing protein n=1 Tax=Candidatus Daviesbacteria bacterium RIFCSPHIGHO2_12_FULL_37_11 TaxID=1797777 RepID=A0A1F5KEN3_9BACT|nr:MAG: hypothetical protein A2769_03220 [Candidatus Daviesbacteria bacterium RIFCSPHIGHO2_01_FULL_37_27]OGE39397.1 MAG: hypothetical protein A3F00_02065 [Candidatus Daviesbacteria bacterium RIFCSPHIGHO2_12_FULL_37_11]OGE45030.1 MAG: hypothetical protein A3B39_05510 [Candidatus Daviesbacteria bacterium RIFCSPLOWO2_01_FULL_37_10]
MAKQFDQQVKDSNILIILHEHTKGGVAHVLRDFLLEKKPESLLFITHPLLYIKESYKKSSYFEWYVNGKLVKKHTGYHWQLPEQLHYFKDFIYTIFWTYNTNTKYNLIIAYDPLNAVSAIVLKLLGRAKKVVYYSIDYFPTRFENTIMNYVYHQIDKIAVKYSGETWNVGARMAKARAETNNMKSEIYKKKQFHVPIGVWFAKIKRKPIDKFTQNKLIYAGGFIDYMGIDMVIKAIPLIFKKIPDISLDLIGRGDEDQKWKMLAKKYEVEKYINFEDWMEDRGSFHLRLSQAAIGLAPFNYHILDDKVKNADPGKIKDYTSSGLPVITTKAIYTWRDIKKFKCGFVIDYNEKEFTKVVIKLLTNKSQLLQYRKNALEYAKQFDWDKIFTENLSRVLNI